MSTPIYPKNLLFFRCRFSSLLIIPVVIFLLPGCAQKETHPPTATEQCPVSMGQRYAAIDSTLLEKSPGYVTEK